MSENKCILLTGSSRGVGSELRDYFLTNGWQVIGLSRSETFSHPRYIHYPVDLASASDIVDIFKTIRKAHSKIDVVINNAAVLTSQYSMIMPPQAAQDMVNVNLLAPFLVSREVAKIMKKVKTGRIINIGSMASSLEPVGDSVYAATKAGISTIANVMAKEFSQLNITCNTVAINAIESDMLNQLPREKIDEIIYNLPIGRYSKINDLLNVIEFFISKKSDAITAQTIFLGGVN
jgi:3-oxoacyl-[acyl-carrier protein] reductase